MDFGWGYFNDYMRVQKNEIAQNKIGVYVNLTGGNFYENNFIDNEIHAIVGPGGGGGLWDSGLFYLNISQELYGFRDAPVGNYWDDWDGNTIPYEICPGWYDYYPLSEPVEIPLITDSEGPYIAIKNYQKEWVNETHYKIKLDYLVTDQSILGGSGSKNTLRYFGCYHFLGPYLRQLDPPYYELEFPWLGYPGPPAGELLGPEILTNTYTGSFESAIVNASWLRGAIMNLYVTDMWGNWNKNDSIAPAISFMLHEPLWITHETNVTLYVLVSDWSDISQVKFIYLNNSQWISVDMELDEYRNLYYVTIPLSSFGNLLHFKVYAEDVYGNSYTTQEQTLDTKGPEIINITHAPIEPTSGDVVIIRANITDPSGVSEAILSYSTDRVQWSNVTMIYNSTIGLYEAEIPAMTSNTTVYYKIYANDTYNNWVISSTYNYTVKAKPKQQTPTTNILLYIATAAIAIAIVATIIVVIRKR